MSRKRKLPYCAFCGGSLVRRARMLVEYGDLHGKPEMGWCDECVGSDPLVAELLPHGDVDSPSRDVIEILAEIGNRGAGRLLIG